MRRFIVSRSFSLSLLAVVSSSGASAFAQAKNATQVELKNKAVQAINLNDFKTSEALYSQAIDSDFRDPGSWQGRSFVRDSLGKADEAMTDNATYAVAMELKGPTVDKNSPGTDGPYRDIFNYQRSESFRLSAEYWLKKDDLLRAYVDSAVSVRVDTSNGMGAVARGWLTRGDVFYALGDFDQAAICLDNAKNVDPSAAREYTRAGASENALKHKPFQESADLSSQFAAGRKAEESGDTQEAFSIYNSAIEIQPLNDASWLLRGTLYGRNSLPTWAISDLTTAIDLGNINGFANTAAALVNRAVAYYGEGRFYEAVLDLEYANKLKPGDADIEAKLSETKSKIKKD